MMKFFFYTTLALTAAAQAAPNLRASKNSVSPQVHRALDDRIINGVVSDKKSFPYYVRLLDGYLCGGTLIAPQVVLYAAHCDFVEEGKSKLQVGAYDFSNGQGETRTCDQVVPHPDYNGLNNDFALCLLNDPVTIKKDFVELVINDKDAVPEAGEDLITLGLGVTEEGNVADKLRNVTVPAISNEVCNQWDYYGPGSITDSMLCAGFEQGQKDSCQGDSGGPIVRRKFVESTGTFVDEHVGVVSWGSGCADPKKPGVYARTSSAHGWIKNTVCNNFKAEANFCGTSPKPDVGCKDKKKKINGKGNGCKNYVAKGKKKAIKKKCKKKTGGKPNWKFCPATCAEFGLGKCAN